MEWTQQTRKTDRHKLAFLFEMQRSCSLIINYAVRSNTIKVLRYTPILLKSATYDKTDSTSYIKAFVELICN